VLLFRRLNWFWCVVLLACGQVNGRAQLFLAAQNSATNSPGPGLVAFGWNPSPDTRATGYFLSWGYASGACTNFLDVGNATNVTVAGLLPNGDYYFAIVTYDAAGDQSPPSNEIMYRAGQADPNVTAWPVASAITYGQTLAASTLSGGSATPDGSFAFTTPSTAPNAGTAPQSVTYTPTDTVNYNTASSTVSVTVNKANPNVTAWPTASVISYGQTLADSTLSGGSATPAGSFGFTAPSTAPNAGTALQGVTYTPTDTVNYKTASSTVSVTVNKANPNVKAWPTASAITYGQTLADSTLSGGWATPAGSFAFTTPSTAPNAGTALQSVTYTPTETADYSTVSSTVSVMVNKASAPTALASSENPSLQGSNVTFTATVTPVAPASTAPTGNVQFCNNGVNMGSPVALTDGLATLSTAELPAGTNTVLAAYLGDGDFLASSNSVAQIVQVIPSTPSTIGILNCADGTVTVAFGGTPQAQYVVQASDDMAAPAWQNVSTNTADADGHWTFRESADGHSIRFYRSAKP
jgi:hypothetical protein